MGFPLYRPAHDLCSEKIWVRGLNVRSPHAQLPTDPSLVAGLLRRRCAGDGRVIASHLGGGPVPRWWDHAGLFLFHCRV